MKQLSRSHVYWPNIDKQIETFVKSCSKCALAAKNPIKVTLSSWPIPSKSWERVHVDYAGPVDNYYFLLLVDAYSKWPEIVKTRSITARATVEILQDIFSRFGSPKQLVSDNGTQFTSNYFKKFCELNAIQHTTIATYHPNSNGQAERFVDSCKRALKKLQGEGSLQENICVFLRSYRSTPNRMAPDQKSPAELMFGRPMRTVLDLMKEIPTPLCEQRRNDKQELQYNKKHGAKPKSFNVDDKVYAKVHHNGTERWEEGEVIERVGQVMYNVLLKHRLIRAHADQLRIRYVKPETNEHTSPVQLSFNTLLDAFNLVENPAPVNAEIDEVLPANQLHVQNQIPQQNTIPENNEASNADNVPPISDTPARIIQRRTSNRDRHPPERYGLLHLKGRDVGNTSKTKK